MELLAPVGHPAGLLPALQAGADAVYVGLKDDTNARRFAGLNFTPAELHHATQQCHRHQRKLYVAINTFPQPGQEVRWQRAVDAAAAAGVNAIIMADPGLLAYAAQHYPQTERHLSVQTSAANLPTLRLFAEQFGITRAVLPRVLDIHQIERIAADSPVELEVFAAGSLCVMAEGRCQLSTWISGQSPNSGGACSPASLVQWRETAQGREIRLGGALLDRLPPHRPSGYPTVCKGRYRVNGQPQHAIASPCSLSTLPLLKRLAAAGITCLKLEGRQRSPVYTSQITRVWRQALDQLQRQGDAFQLDPRWQQQLRQLSEGQTLTTGPYLPGWQ
ncbi:ubiquinone anaerobic biosynthesis protein UbiU [Ferrimonas pelagia]|uniref:U32 family peptidase n=1 Tax=Ferrimonas pelagia TaxID=1177826 RepID=A0ABP9EFX8_9GAMM